MALDNYQSGLNLENYISEGILQFYIAKLISIND